MFEILLEVVFITFLAITLSIGLWVLAFMAGAVCVKFIWELFFNEKSKERDED